jgi:Protein of unknown function (DUF3012)
MRFNYGIARVLLLVGCLVWLGGCTPEVGSDEWCAEMKQKPPKDWTAQQAADYTKYCVFKLKKQ